MPEGTGAMLRDANMLAGEDHMIRQFLRRLRIYSGEKLCELCGKANVLSQGYEDWNCRYYCQSCGHVTVVCSQ